MLTFNEWYNGFDSFIMIIITITISCCCLLHIYLRWLLAFMRKRKREICLNNANHTELAAISFGWYTFSIDVSRMLNSLSLALSLIILLTFTKLEEIKKYLQYGPNSWPKTFVLTRQVCVCAIRQIIEIAKYNSNS